MKALLVLASVSVLGLSACSAKSSPQDSVPTQNVVRAGDGSVKRSIGDGQVQMQVLGRKAFAESLSRGELLLPNGPQAYRYLMAKVPAEADAEETGPVQAPTGPTPIQTAAPDTSLLLGFPVGLLGEQNIFGGVITEVSDHANEMLGGLKLTDLPPVHVRTVITGISAHKPALTLVGCASKCTEASEEEVVVSFPIIGVDEKNNQLIVDLAAVGKDLDLITMLDPDGEALHLKATSSETTDFDFSVSTLVFDVKTHMLPKVVKEGETPKETTFVVRWYLKLSSAFNPAFASRAPTDGVGFFKTERAAETKITRFSFSDFGTTPVKYFIKKVPTEYQPYFAAALDGWNEQFKAIVGHPLLKYEFIPETDERNDILIPGDIRYNIIEWDLNNLAGYGGLGPSIANQFTGETLAANILVQGPTIVKMYQEWFKLKAQSDTLRALGQNSEAEGIELAFKRKTQAMIEARTAPRFELNLKPGKGFAFRVTSQEPSLEDPLMQRNDFDDLPSGFTYETYISGYFRDMIQHEMGHNLGLRHNFRGNLGAADVKSLGTVSRSVMEYLNRGFRYLDEIGPYDTMAITYGYTGKKPEHTDWFCTDEDVVSEKNATASAECSRDDATNDPFSYLESRLASAIDKLVARGQTTPPTWTIADMERELGIAVKGMAYYAFSADATASTWSNFFGKSDRPANAAGVKNYVLGKIKAKVCDPSLEQVVGTKADDDARTKTRANVEAVRKAVLDLVAPLKIFTAEDLSCVAVVVSSPSN